MTRTVCLFTLLYKTAFQGCLLSKTTALTLFKQNLFEGFTEVPVKDGVDERVQALLQ